MSLFYVAILVLTIRGMHWRESCSLDASLEVKQANVVKGIFIMLVFLSHIRPYITESGYIFDEVNGKVLSWLNFGQSIVIMFLFYSGYGIHRQIQKRGVEYVTRLPKHRILNTLLNFDVAVLVFLLLAIIQRAPLTTGKTLLAFIGWESLGNSNWYIFDIIILYGIVWLTHICFKKQLLQWGVFTFLVLVFTFAMLLFRPFWWWDTIFCFWGGYSLSCFKERIQKILEGNWWYVLAGCVISFFLFQFLGVACGKLHSAGVIRGWVMLPWLWLNLLHLAIGFFIILLTMRLQIQCQLLEWCGEHLFPIYIYQRIPMLLIPPCIIAQHHLFYLFFCLVTTLIIANYYRFWQIKL